jgi:sortase (surface protein transpeptidase)
MLPKILQAVPLMAALMTHCGAAASTKNEPSISVPSIGLSIGIVVGDQRQIDQGNVVNYGHADEGGCWPGQGCTVWLAGHRTSHGGVFRSVPRLIPGDEISLRYDGSTVVYVVTETALVDRVDPPADFMHGDLMIQTSWTGGRVLLVYADLSPI